MIINEEKIDKEQIQKLKREVIKELRKFIKIEFRDLKKKMEERNPYMSFFR